MGDTWMTREDAEALGLITPESPAQRAAREAELLRLTVEADELRRQIEAARGQGRCKWCGVLTAQAILDEHHGCCSDDHFKANRDWMTL